MEITLLSSKSAPKRAAHINFTMIFWLFMVCFSFRPLGKPFLSGLGDFLHRVRFWGCGSVLIG